MKITLRVILWMKLLDARSESVLSLEEVQHKKAILDIKTGIQKIDSVEWPIIGYVPFSDREQAALANEPHWITNYSCESIEEIAEWKLSGKRGLPPHLGKPYVGYRG